MHSKYKMKMIQWNFVYPNISGTRQFGQSASSDNGVYQLSQPAAFISSDIIGADVLIT